MIGPLEETFRFVARAASGGDDDDAKLVSSFPQADNKIKTLPIWQAKINESNQVLAPLIFILKLRNVACGVHAMTLLAQEVR